MLRLSATTRILLIFLSTVIASATSAMGHGNPFDTPPGQIPGQPASNFGDSRDRVTVTARAALTDVTPGSEIPIAVVFNHQPNWHSWPPPNVSIEGAATFEGAIRTQVVPEVPVGSPITLHPSHIQQPEAHLVELALLGEPQKFAVLEGTVVTYVPVTIADDAPVGDAIVTVKVTFQSCDNRLCMRPVFDYEIPVTLNVIEGDPITATDLELSGVFAQFEPSIFGSLNDAPPTVFTPTEEPPPGGYFDSRQQVDVSARIAAIDVTPGSRIALAITLKHQPGWHTWPPEGITIEGADEFDEAEHILVSTDPGADAPLTAHTGFMQWPEAHLTPMDISGTGTPQNFAVMEGETVAYLPVTIHADARPGPIDLPLAVYFQSCDDQFCLPPATHELTVRLNIVEGEPVVASVDSLPAGFENFDSTIFQKIAAATGDGTSTIAPPPSSGSAASVARPTFFGITLPSTEGPLGLLILALLSALGGFILNLTPCVLPIIPIKILTISQHAGSPGKSLMLGLWMAIGVVAFWFAIGIPVAFIAGVTDPSRIFGIWWLTLGIGLVIGGAGIGIMGLFQFRIPNALYAVNPKADTAWGSFVFGVMTAVLGLPCFGFVAGALLAGAATLPALTVLVIFFSIGVGMAAPYLVLAAKPSLVDRIPRTGPASELVKQVMGLLLLAAAAFFIGSGLIALVSEQPYMGKQLHWWAVALFAGIAAFWLIVRTFAITKRVGPRISFLVIGVAVAGLAALYATDSTAKARSSYELTKAADAESPGTFNTKTWVQWTPAKFEAAREAGHVVVLDFTAEWCLICKSLKATVLNRDPVKSQLGEDDVVTFSVDLTSLKDPGWDYLRSLGQTGIPMLAVFKPNDETPWMSNAYTPQQVLEALDWARTTQVAQKN